MTEAYDPLDYDNLANSVVTALLGKGISPLPPAESFAGSGVYAIYYMGDLPCYSHISSPRCKVPIYVGKAIPSGGRKGSKARGNTPGKELFWRLKQHATSIKQTGNLKPDEFKCRYLVVERVWIELAEKFLVGHFHPVWNTVLDGFGNHNVGEGRTKGARPRWDILHPGRPWADGLAAKESPKDIIASINASRR